MAPTFEHILIQGVEDENLHQELFEDGRAQSQSVNLRLRVAAPVQWSFFGMLAGPVQWSFFGNLCLGCNPAFFPQWNALENSG